MKQSKQENLIYLAAWGLLFASPLLRQQPGIRMVGSVGRMAIVRHLSAPVSDP